MTMNKSLNSILEAEEALVNNINASILSAKHFLDADDEISRSLGAKYHEAAEGYRQQLDTVRDELREYLRELLS